MKWIKQIFGIKEEEIILNEKFQNASATSELVISPRQSEIKTELTEKDLKKLTKIEIDELAKTNLGIDLDRRSKKTQMIQDYIEAQNN